MTTCVFHPDRAEGARRRGAVLFGRQPEVETTGSLERKKKHEGRGGSGGEAVWSTGEKNEEERRDTHVDIPTVVRTLP